MGHAIPKQHPAVVLRSQFNLVRALLGVAMVALVGLTIAVVILANDDTEVQPAQSVEAAPVVPNASSLPAYPTPEVADPSNNRAYSGAAPTRKLDGSTDVPSPAPVAPGTRYDGGPDEGTRGIQSGSGVTVNVNPSTGLPGTRYDGGPDEGTRSPLTSRIAPGTRYDGGPDEGTRGPGSTSAPESRFNDRPEGTTGPGFRTD
jgi:hypothetical protein